MAIDTLQVALPLTARYDGASQPSPATLGRLGITHLHDIEATDGAPPTHARFSLPDGWSIETNGASALVIDDLERVRVLVNEGRAGAPAFLEVQPRLQVGLVGVDADHEEVDDEDMVAFEFWQVRDMADPSGPLFRSDDVPKVHKAHSDEATYRASNVDLRAKRKDCLDWIEENYPDGDPAAYWGEPLPAPASRGPRP